MASKKCEVYTTFLSRYIFSQKIQCRIGGQFNPGNFYCTLSHFYVSSCTSCQIGDHAKLDGVYVFFETSIYLSQPIAAVSQANIQSAGPTRNWSNKTAIPFPGAAVTLTRILLALVLFYLYNFHQTSEFHLSTVSGNTESKYTSHEWSKAPKIDDF